jgi:peptide/nickel transport system permease protein
MADTLLVQAIDLFIALPGLILALIITVMIGANMQNLVIVLGLVMWPEMARLVRGQVLGLREALFVEAAHSIGCGPIQMLTTHIGPNIMRTVAAQFAIAVSSAIFTAASLGFLGLGLPPPAADWGTMVQTGFDYLSLNPLLSLAPGAAVALTVLGFYLIGQTVD